MSTTMTRVPAGWYPDPLGDAGTTRRWWNGEVWTEYTAPLLFGSASSASSTPSGERSAVDRVGRTDPGAAAGTIVAGTPLAPTAHDSALAALAMTLHPASSAQSGWDVLPSVSAATVFSPVVVTPDPAPATAGSDLGAPASAEPIAPPAAAAVRVHTSAIWILTAMPVVHLLLSIAMATQYPVELPGWTFALALLLPFVCSAGLAGVDARLLGEDGHPNPAPWWLALVMPPLYLLVRAVRLGRVRRSAWAPTVVWAGVQATALGVGVLLAPAGVAAAVALIV